jgi:hypothetical protein
MSPGNCSYLRNLSRKILQQNIAGLLVTHPIRRVQMLATHSFLGVCLDVGKADWAS